MLPLDLHVLGLPLAFILSQDQTLHCCTLSNLLSNMTLSRPSSNIKSWFVILFYAVYTNMLNELQKKRKNLSKNLLLFFPQQPALTD